MKKKMNQLKKVKRKQWGKSPFILSKDRRIIKSLRYE